MELDKNGFLVEHNFHIHGHVNSQSMPKALSVMEASGFVVTFSEMVDGGLTIYHHAHPELNFDVDRSVPLDSPDLLVWEPEGKIPADMKLKFRTDEEMLNIALKKVYTESLEYSEHEIENAMQSHETQFYHKEDRFMEDAEKQEILTKYRAKQYFYDNFLEHLSHDAGIVYATVYEGKSELQPELSILCEHPGVDVLIHGLEANHVNLEFDPSRNGGLRMTGNPMVPFDVSVSRCVQDTEGSDIVRTDAQLVVIALDKLYRRKLLLNDRYIEDSLRAERVAILEETGNEIPTVEANNYRYLLEKEGKALTGLFDNLAHNYGVTLNSIDESSYEMDKGMTVTSTVANADFDKAVEILKESGFEVDFRRGLSVRDSNAVDSVWFIADRKVPENAPYDMLSYTADASPLLKPAMKMVTRDDKHLLDIVLKRMYRESMKYTDKQIHAAVEFRRDYLRTHEWHEMSDKEIVALEKSYLERRDFNRNLFKRLRNEAGFSFTLKHSAEFDSRKRMAQFMKRLDALVGTYKHFEEQARKERLEENRKRLTELYKTEHSGLSIITKPFDISTVLDMSDLEADRTDKKGHRKPGQTR